MEGALHGMAEKISMNEGMTRPGMFIFEFLRGLNITDATVPVLNTTIDMATNVLQVGVLI